MSTSVKYEEVATKLLNRASEALDTYEDPASLLKIAEAIAWARYPNQPHGGAPNAD